MNKKKLKDARIKERARELESIKKEVSSLRKRIGDAVRDRNRERPIEDRVETIRMRVMSDDYMRVVDSEMWASHQKERIMRDIASTLINYIKIRTDGQYTEYELKFVKDSF